jgi:hypothetical protein
MMKMLTTDHPGTLMPHETPKRQGIIPHTHPILNLTKINSEEPPTRKWSYRLFRVSRHRAHSDHASTEHPSVMLIPLFLLMELR